MNVAEVVDMTKIAVASDNEKVVDRISHMCCKIIIL